VSTERRFGRSLARIGAWVERQEQRRGPASCKGCRKVERATSKSRSRSEETYLERPAKKKIFVNQWAGDVAEVLHLFDQNRESAIQRNKSPEEDWKPREHRPSKQLIPVLMRTSFKREESPKTELQRCRYHRDNIAIAHPVREATNGKMAWVFERRKLRKKKPIS